MSEEKVLIGIIGGSGLYHIDNLTFVKTVNPETPWGFPSSPITIASLPSGTRVAFLTRHGVGHFINPSAVPARANIAALKSLGVRAIIAFSAVGSLREEISPGSFVLPNQIIDRTKGIRPASFFQDTTIVTHAMFGDPFSNKFVKWLESRVQKALELGGGDRKLFTEKCIQMYRQWGGDLINMSVLPEAKLAREAELSYALIATATDYDSWRPQSDAVTAHDVFKTLKENADTSRLVAATILDDLQAAITGDEASVFLEEVGSMKFSIMPRSERQSLADRQKLSYILPEYFSGEETTDVSSL
ncbi:nucleoside phosphorylase domain-containing protein [Flammula alnicola]|nr:nucleoside phosphorylase domain-containing protein [Flammula alnicola]